MALSVVKNTTVAGITAVVPKIKVDNLLLGGMSDDQKKALVKHTGIRYRRVVASNEERIQDYFAQAIRDLCTKLNWKKEDIGILICVTQTPNVPIPSIACLLHDDLKLSQETLCYDINSGCSGFVYGMHTISNLLNSLEDSTKKAVLCCGDFSSQLTEQGDSATQPIFSDGVAAIGFHRLSKWEDKITGYYNLETLGSGKNAIYMEEKTASRFMRLNGIDVFNYSVKYVPKNILTLYEKYGFSNDQIDAAVFHQANRLINESIRKKIGLPEEKLPYSLYEYGNTASASIPLTWCSKHQEMLSTKKWQLVSGFGVGFSLASAIIPFEPNYCGEPQIFNTTT